MTNNISNNSSIRSVVSHTALTAQGSNLSTTHENSAPLSVAAQAGRVADCVRRPAPAVENATWYIDWTSWDYPIPEGVDTVNIFVGQFTMVDGKATMNGFGNFTSEKMQAFVFGCHQKGINVKLSIGGGGGSYCRCWDQLTPSNVKTFAQGMADFCHLYGINGVDFDYEEFASVNQEVLVGQLIKNFKAIDPQFQTSLCCNAGFSAWQPEVKTILDAAKDSSGTCAVDRIVYHVILQSHRRGAGMGDSMVQLAAAKLSLCSFAGDCRSG